MCTLTPPLALFELDLAAHKHHKNYLLLTTAPNKTGSRKKLLKKLQLPVQLTCRQLAKEDDDDDEEEAQQPVVCACVCFSYLYALLALQTNALFARRLFGEMQ